MLVLRRQTRSTDKYTSIAAVSDIKGAEGSLTCFFASEGQDQKLYAACAILNSFMFNYLASKRQSGPNLNKNIWSSVPVPGCMATGLDALSEAAKSLHEMSPLDPSRTQVRCNIEAQVFYMYLREADSLALTDLPAISLVDYVLDQFRVLRNSELRSSGEFRSKRLVLEACDRLFEG